MTEDTFLDSLSQWVNSPPPFHPDVVNKPEKLFRYVGGYKMFRGQKPRMVNPPKAKHVLKFRSAHP